MSTDSLYRSSAGNHVAIDPTTRMTSRPLPEYSDIANNMADLGKEEVPYSADDYLPSSPRSVERKRKLGASDSAPAGANSSPSDVQPSKVDEEGELVTEELKRARSREKDQNGHHGRSDSHRREERDDRHRDSHHSSSSSSRRSPERDHSRRDKERDRHHDRRDRRDDHRRERSHSRDRDREGHSRDRHAPDRSRDRDRDRDHERGHDRERSREHGSKGGGRDSSKGGDKRKERSPSPKQPLPPAPEYVSHVYSVLTLDRPVLNVVVKSVEEQEEEERRLIEERRKRRVELLAKLQQGDAGTAATAQPATAPVATPSATASASAPTASASSPVGPVRAVSNASSPVAPTTPKGEGDDMFGELTAAEAERLEKEKARIDAEEQLRCEREEEAQEEADRKALEKLWANAPVAANASAPTAGDEEVQEMKQQAKEEAAEMDAEFDMFADSPSKIAEKIIPLKTLVERRENSTMIDNWDDADGYYNFRIGEVLADRYVVFNAYGKGVFSSVVRAKDLQDGESEVAVKLIRNNDVMHKAGQKELMILGLIRDADPENKRHCIRLLHSFEYRSHLCMVLEPLAMNLREVIKKYGKDVGLNITAVKVYAKQMFIALRHLRKCNVIHADIKPDNILVNESKTTLKLCDFGSASLVSENDITPYLVSRFYRAPEISCQYDFALDMWSIGCCLVELYTGKILFDKGRSNNQMLRLMMEMRGKIPNKMLKKAMPMIRSQHFDDDFNFISKTIDPVTKKELAKPLLITQPTRDLSTILNVSARYLTDKEQKEVMLFKDLLERIFTFEKEKRITPKEALAHPFIAGPAAAPKK